MLPKKKKKSSDPAKAFHTAVEQLEEAIAALENSNQHDEYIEDIQSLQTILLKSQSIQTKQIQQLSEDDVQGLRDAKNSMENYITDDIQKNIKILEDEIVSLKEYSQNGIKTKKTKDDLIYQQEVRYLNTLNSENEKLKNYLIEKRDQCVELNVKIFIDDNLVQNQNINFNDSEFDANEMIEKLESSNDNLNDEIKKLIVNIRNQLNNEIGNCSTDDLECLGTEKKKLAEFITNQCDNFEIEIRKEAFNAFNSSSDGLQLINDIQILREEKVRLENHLKKKITEQIELNQPTLKEFMEKYGKFNDEANKIENELTTIKDKNNNIIDRQRRLRNQLNELNKESEEDLSIKNSNAARNQLIQQLKDNNKDLYNQKCNLKNYLTEKYDLLIQLVNLSDEHPITEKYVEYRESLTPDKHLISYGGERINDIQILYKDKGELKTYSNTQLKKAIDDFNFEKQKLEKKFAYINATEKYQNLQTDIRLLHENICECKSDLVKKHNQLLKLEKFIKDDASIHNNKDKLMEEIQPFNKDFEIANQNNIENLIDECEQTIKKYKQEISNLQGERNYIVSTIDSVKAQIESDLINKYRQLIQLDEFKKWTLVTDEYHNNIKKIKDIPNLSDTINIPNASDTNEQNNTDQIRQLETNISNLEGDIKSKDEEIRELKGNLEARDIKLHELIELNSSLKTEAAIYSSELGKATNFEFGDHDSNNIGQLSSGIKKLKHDLEFFCTLRKSTASLNEPNMKKLLKKYSCSTEVLGKNYNRSFLEGILQRNIIEVTISDAQNYLDTDGRSKEPCLEAKINSATNRLQEYTTSLSTQRFGTDKVSPAIPTKLRQMVYTLLSNRGFSKNKDESEHPVIERLTKNILQIMNSCRVIKDSVKNREIESMATEIVRQIIVIFLFRFKVQEPIIEFLWFESRDKLELEFMEFSVDEDFKNAEVGICSFPLIVTNFKKPNHKVISKASIVKKSF
ncbi:microtubule-associated protein 1a [Gigaspora margarita]|uniref:Microtubule-associated protein 1a n=1 Tax=Gigaspora margarita TaxID=4874 RepID=A0A8H3XAJ9_GIGMA|nr:microtubule-associated protein 1a [Gigaspora margarita]